MFHSVVSGSGGILKSNITVNIVRKMPSLEPEEKHDYVNYVVNYYWKNIRLMVGDWGYDEHVENYTD